MSLPSSPKYVPHSPKVDELYIDGQMADLNEIIPNEHPLSIEINELKRKIERKDIELKRKDKELSLLQKEYQKSCKLNEEMVIAEQAHVQQIQQQAVQSPQNVLKKSTDSIEKDIKQANEVLNAQGVLSKYHYDELKAAFDTTTHQCTKLAKKLEFSKSKINTLEEKLNHSTTALLHTQNEYKQSEQKLNDLQYLKQDNESLMKKIDVLQIEKSNYKNLNIQYIDQITMDMSIKEELKKENEQLNEAIVALRTEKDNTIQLLEKKLYDTEITATLQGNQYQTLYEELMIKQREMETYSETLRLQNNDILKSLDANIELVRGSEEEKHLLRQAIDQINETYHKLLIEKTEMDSVNSKQIIKLKTKIDKLKQQNASLATQFNEYKALFANSNVVKTNMFNDLMEMKVKLVNLERTLGSEIELKNLEAKKVIKLEEINDQLYSKISFLKQQLSAAATADMSSSEYIQILNGHVGVLFEANLYLRKKLIEQVEENNEEIQVFRFHNSNNNNNNTDDSSNNNNGSDGYAVNEEVSKLILPRLSKTSPERFRSQIQNDHTSTSNSMNNNININSINKPTNATNNKSNNSSTNNKPSLSLLPSSVASLIERAMFDHTCAFLSENRSSESVEIKSSGVSSKSNKIANKTLTSSSGGDTFSAKIFNNATPMIVVNDTMPSMRQVEAAEFLHHFNLVEFTQQLHDHHIATHVMIIIMDKLVDLLNFVYSYNQEVMEQMNIARTELGKQTARIMICVNNVEKLSDTFLKERALKQQLIIQDIAHRIESYHLKAAISKVYNQQQLHHNARLHQNQHIANTKTVDNHTISKTADNAAPVLVVTNESINDTSKKDGSNLVQVISESIDIVTASAADDTTDVNTTVDKLFSPSSRLPFTVKINIELLPLVTTQTSPVNNSIEQSSSSPSSVAVLSPSASSSIVEMIATSSQSPSPLEKSQFQLSLDELFQLIYDNSDSMNNAVESTLSLAAAVAAQKSETNIDAEDEDCDNDDNEQNQHQQATNSAAPAVSSTTINPNNTSKKRIKDQKSYELNLTSSRIDDETLHSVVKLIMGELNNTYKSNIDLLVFQDSVRISNQSFLQNIITIDLSNNSLTDIACKDLHTVLKESQSLIALDLRHNCISYQGVLVLKGGLKENLNIYDISLGSNNSILRGRRRLPFSRNNNNNNNTADSAENNATSSNDGQLIKVDIRDNDETVWTVHDMLQLQEYHASDSHNNTKSFNSSYGFQSTAQFQNKNKKSKKSKTKSKATNNNSSSTRPMSVSSSFENSVNDYDEIQAINEQRFNSMFPKYPSSAATNNTSSNNFNSSRVNNGGSAGMSGSPPRYTEPFDQQQQQQQSLSRSLPTALVQYTGVIDQQGYKKNNNNNNRDSLLALNDMKIFRPASSSSSALPITQMFTPRTANEQYVSSSQGCRNTMTSLFPPPINNIQQSQLSSSNNNNNNISINNFTQNRPKTSNIIDEYEHQQKGKHQLTVKDRTNHITKSIYTNKIHIGGRDNNNNINNNNASPSNNMLRLNSSSSSLSQQKSDLKSQLLSPWQSLLKNIESGNVISKPKGSKNK